MKNDRWHEIVGAPLEQWVKSKWSTQKKGAAILDIAPSTLSQYISGERKPSPEHQLKIIRSGFDKLYFELYYELDKINPDLLTTEQIKQVIISQQFQILQYRDLVNTLMKKIP